ncbi:MAG: zinc-finger domain-containing protein [Gammaproteobacteria bacterium]|nr:zinc-finger domain-containing protein [Gammaproteobacteria bacterium]
MVNKKKPKQAVNISSYFVVNKNELPLSCPMPDMETWSLHPKIYLPIAETGEAICPYCSTRYILSREGIA